jgi:hypothetical protein
LCHPLILENVAGRVESEEVAGASEEYLEEGVAGAKLAACDVLALKKVEGFVSFGGGITRMVEETNHVQAREPVQDRTHRAGRAAEFPSKSVQLFELGAPRHAASSRAKRESRIVRTTGENGITELDVFVELKERVFDDVCGLAWRLDRNYSDALVPPARHPHIRARMSLVRSFAILRTSRP